MRNVSRGPEPPSLVQDAETWTKELLSAIKSCKISGEKVTDAFYKKYNKTDVRAALETMYGRRCCYCEAPVKVVTKGHIEHRKPKRKLKQGVHEFPESTFDWDNLHLVCPECNSAKGSKWDPKDEILDAATDVPISEHLSYEIDEDKGVLRTAISGRGFTTIDHAKLNRDDLVNARLQVLLKILSYIEKIRGMGDNPNVPIKKQTLQEKQDGDYGSFIRWAIEKYGWSIV